MQSALIQLKTAYEQEGMTPEEIADDLDLELESVKAGLTQVSSKYRRDCGKEPAEIVDSLNFTNDQLLAVNEIIFQTALAAEHSDGSIDWKTRLAAAQYIRDDKKGRKEPAKLPLGNTFNILQFNEQIADARQRVKQLKEENAIEVLS